tara:strand:+ start:2343 stop:2783 length:441 start_codon:yes stop_codon:yes gene_type:complete
MFNLKPEDRIHFWRNFRANLSNMETKDALESVNNLWATCPTTNGYLDYADCTDWPDPWTLLDNNHYCEVAVALGIFYTIYLAEILDNNTLKIVIYKDKQNFVNSVHIDKYALNISYNEILNTSSVPLSLEELHVYMATDLKASKYL